MKIDLTFRSQYEVEQWHGQSSELEDIKRFCFPKDSIDGFTNNGLLIMIKPHASTTWLGAFAFGYDSPKALTGIYSCPDENSVCVVSSGRAYLVKANDPCVWELVKAYPILDVRPIASKNLLLFADFTTMTAYGPKGFAWKTARLSWDGLKITEVSSQHIRGLAWDALQEREVEFLVDLETGMHKGGASPDQYLRPEMPNSIH